MKTLAVLPALCLLLFAGSGAAQQTKIKRVPMQPTSRASGRDMFMQYCAACHGKDAKGDGPAASALKVPPPDLTILAQKNGGKFPAIHVANVLRSGADVPAHGTKEMPIWGPLFGSLEPGHPGLVEQRVSNVTEYIKSLQVK